MFIVHNLSVMLSVRFSSLCEVYRVSFYIKLSKISVGYDIDKPKEGVLDA